VVTILAVGGRIDRSGVEEQGYRPKPFASNSSIRADWASSLPYPPSHAGGSASTSPAGPDAFRARYSSRCQLLGRQTCDLRQALEPSSDLVGKVDVERRHASNRTGPREARAAPTKALRATQMQPKYGCTGGHRGIRPRHVPHTEPLVRATNTDLAPLAETSNTGFSSRCRKAWRFESSRPHQPPPPGCRPVCGRLAG
jgi:hypothetical protein